jgi:predicted dehydrogenase
MADQPKLRVGIIGAGWAGEGQAFGFRACERTELVGVSNRTRETAEKLAETFDIPNVVGDYRALLDLGVDIVGVTTPGHTHHEMTMAALDRGVHVLCEKPMAMNAGEAQDMVRLADEKGLVGAIAFTWRETPTFRHARELISTGHIGHVREIHDHTMWASRPVMVDGWMSRLEHGGGVLYQAASHEIDRVRTLLGREITRVCGKPKFTTKKAVKLDKKMYFREQMGWRPDEPIEKYDTVDVTADTGYSFIVDFTDEVTGVFRAGAGQGNGIGRVIELYGTEGTLILSDGGLEHSPYGKREFKQVEIPERHGKPFEPGMNVLNRLWSELIDSFVQRIDGEDAELASFWDGMKGQQVIDAVRQSDVEGRWIDIK